LHAASGRKQNARFVCAALPGGAQKALCAQSDAAMFLGGGLSVVLERGALQRGCGDVFLPARLAAKRVASCMVRSSQAVRSPAAGLFLLEHHTAYSRLSVALLP
jgi:hypothetical protein